MVIRQERKPSFVMAGIAQQGGLDQDFVAPWRQMYLLHAPATLEALGSGQSFGASYGMDENGQFTYMAGYDVRDGLQARAMGLTVLEVPAYDYVIAELHGPVPQCIHEGWDAVNNEYLAQQGLKRADAPDFEVYVEGDIHAADYRMELWVPVEPA